MEFFCCVLFIVELWVNSAIDLLSGLSMMSEGVLHCLRQLFVQENQYRQFSRGDQLVAGGFFDLIRVNN